VGTAGTPAVPFRYTMRMRASGAELPAAAVAGPLLGDPFDRGGHALANCGSDSGGMAGRAGERPGRQLGLGGDLLYSGTGRGGNPRRCGQQEPCDEQEYGDRVVVHGFYMLPEFIMRGPIRKMGSMEPVNTRAIRMTAMARVMKLMISVKSAMYCAVSSS
jgi:hypothetical protein